MSAFFTENMAVEAQVPRCLRPQNPWQVNSILDRQNNENDM
ncbi:hypothetical protein HMPREF9374_1547 [Desmospora sp. 8437]|nr:hypothetical protein HMPREF9374_1547 [Desmospora sp. 8437]